MKGYAKTREHRILYKTQTLAQLDKKFSNPYYNSSLLELLTQIYCMQPTGWNLEHKTEQTTIKWRTLNSNCTVAVFSLLCIPFQMFGLTQFHTSCKVCLMLDASWSHISHFVSTRVEIIYVLVSKINMKYMSIFVSCFLNVEQEKHINSWPSAISCFRHLMSFSVLWTRCSDKFCLVSFMGHIHCKSTHLNYVTESVLKLDTHSACR